MNPAASMVTATAVVKTPRSSGCRNCVRRRKKCDQAFPQCIRCLKSNLQCSGYQNTIRFLDEGPQLRTRMRNDGAPPRPQRRVPGASATGPATRPSVVLPNRSLATPSSVRPHHISSHSSQNQRAPEPETSSVLVLVSPSAHQDQLLCKLIQSLARQGECCTLFNGDHVWSIWLQGLARYAHVTSALNSAIQAMALSHLGGIFHDQGLVLASRRQYGKALAQLNVLLQSPSTALSLDALATTVLLSFYETQNCTDGQMCWLQHARGAARLFQLRGPRLHREGLGRLTLVAYRSFLIVTSLVIREPCFLCTPRWRDVFADNTDPQAPVEAAIGTFYHELARHPNEYRAMIANLSAGNSQGLETLFTESRTRKEQVKDAHLQIINAIQENLTEPTITELPSHEDESGDEVVQAPVSITSIYCAFWSELSFLYRTWKTTESSLRSSNDNNNNNNTAIAQKSLQQPEKRADLIDRYEQDCVRKCRTPCITISALSVTGFLRPAFLVFVLQKAVLFLSPDRDIDATASKKYEAVEEPYSSFCGTGQRRCGFGGYGLSAAEWRTGWEGMGELVT